MSELLCAAGTRCGDANLQGLLVRNRFTFVSDSLLESLLKHGPPPGLTDMQRYGSILMNEVFSLVKPSAVPRLMLEYLSLVVLDQLLRWFDFTVSVDLIKSAGQKRPIGYKLKTLGVNIDNEAFIFDIEEASSKVAGVDAGSVPLIFTRSIFEKVVDILVKQGHAEIEHEPRRLGWNCDFLSDIVEEMVKRMPGNGDYDKTLYVNLMRSINCHMENKLGLRDDQWDSQGSKFRMMQASLLAVLHTTDVQYWCTFSRAMERNKNLKFVRIYTEEQDRLTKKGMSVLLQMDKVWKAQYRRQHGATPESMSDELIDGLSTLMTQTALRWIRGHIANYFMILQKQGFQRSVNINVQRIGQRVRAGANQRRRIRARGANREAAQDHDHMSLESGDESVESSERPSQDSWSEEDGQDSD